ncbi:MAG TPA: SPOR domain-containing protein [Thermoanaerobaculia bacterium]
MRSCSLVAALLMAIWGCSHAAAPPPRPPVAAPMPGSASPRQAPSAGAAASSVALDPTEAITPRELASIPDPVPEAPPRVATGNPVPGESETTIPAAATDAPAPDSPATDSQAAGRAPAPRAEPSDERRWVWRVQVFASPDLEQAERIAKGTSSRFGEPSVIEFESPLYKVRLGAFASEALAQTLRERAVREGFPGAFRMRSPQSMTSSSK